MERYFNGYQTTVAPGGYTSGSGVLNVLSTSGITLNAGDTCRLPGLVDAALLFTSPLIAYLDNTNYSGLPFTPTGTNVTLSFSPTGNLIFSL